MFFQNKHQTEFFQKLKNMFDTQLHTMKQQLTNENRLLKKEQTEDLKATLATTLETTLATTLETTLATTLEATLATTLEATLATTLEAKLEATSNSLNQNISQFQSSLNKHNMAIENLLDSLEEKQSETEHIQNQFRESEQTEKHLLELFDAYQEQFWNLKRFADTKDPIWSDQISLMEETLESSRRLCGIIMINECGAAVDYDLHEVIQVTDTTDTSLDKRVAAIYRCGYLYKGTVVKKAQVNAYRACIHETSK